ncbi:MAG: PHP domain-containing protein [Gammaproteobacteria bacterium]|jgi:3',5'-nucleoside bisphosphate phosphatase|nr:PHP domain-containing protein [Gammaproteobacteria bacterium]MBT5203823.1 PHP domain-containing protein [Gammaproteobacteria bacterium]MBT5603141.1 PHP domain-containing protein [Gammaproteobacteria bacterium]MBT6245965.1 PHP domain-containing protein [Gammaproteobacteria bacterium]
MNRKIAISMVILINSLSMNCFSHGVLPVSVQEDPDRLIQFPDTKFHKTLILDPHTHSTFSDGHVWPTIRVSEALKDGLDAIAITEHLEWQPHLADIRHPDRNRSYNIAVEANGENDLMVIPGAEITRNAPAGHINALFLQDANLLLPEFTPTDPGDTLAYYREMNKWPDQNVINAANEQGAFLFWNHAWWGRDFPNGLPIAAEFHKFNAEKKLIHGIEIANGSSYSEEAFQIALDLDLTLMGVSDIHNLIDWDFPPAQGRHRPVTLVLAENRSQAAIRAALFKGRTIVWFNNLLIGHKPHLDELLAASLEISDARYIDKSQILQVEISNHSDADFQVSNNSQYTFTSHADLLSIKPHQTTTIGVKTGTRVKQINLQFKVLNALIKPKQTAQVNLSSSVENSD